MPMFCKAISMYVNRPGFSKFCILQLSIISNSLIYVTVRDSFLPVILDDILGLRLPPWVRRKKIDCSLHWFKRAKRVKSCVAY